MARTPMVTRTIVTTKVTAMCVDIKQGETETREFIIPRSYKDNATALKTLEKIYNTGDFKVVSVIAKEEQETLYGMTEDEFINHAEKLPPRTSKNE